MRSFVPRAPYRVTASHHITSHRLAAARTHVPEVPVASSILTSHLTLLLDALPVKLETIKKRREGLATLKPRANAPTRAQASPNCRHLQRLSVPLLTEVCRQRYRGEIGEIPGWFQAPAPCPTSNTRGARPFPLPARDSSIRRPASSQLPNRMR